MSFNQLLVTITLMGTNITKSYCYVVSVYMNMFLMNVSIAIDKKIKSTKISNSEILYSNSYDRQ